jgi:RimJ/RimL family protein N-acetyltransferase
MLHNVQIEGCAFRLRPVALEDAEFIVNVRTGDPERTRYLHPIPRDNELQREWIREYLERADDYYWIIERLETRESEGTIGIYEVDRREGTGEWGRWVLRPGSLAATESALLVYRAAFERLGLSQVSPCTIAENKRVVSFHDSCGLPRTSYLQKHYNLDGRSYDAVRHTCTKESWEQIKRTLEQQSGMVAARLRRVVAPPKR